MRPPLRFAAALTLAAVIVGLALLQLRGWDGTVNADGVSYLDLARQYAHGHLGAFANGYWSPLYPMLVGAASLVAGNPSLVSVAFAVNVLIFAGAALALAAFAWTLEAPAAADGSGAVRLMRALVAGALGVWCLVRMVNATAVTPDALLAAWLFLASAHLASAVHGDASDRRHALFGVVLGLGYWTKAVFFPVAIVALAVLGIVSRRRALVRALVPFVVIAGPLVAVQSWTQGRPSFGETGRLNYGWYVAGAEHAAPVHEAEAATRQRAARGQAAVVALDSLPGAVAFTGAHNGAFPYWLDASRYEPHGGARASLEAQGRVLAFNAHWFRVTAGAFALFVVIGLLAALGRARPRARVLSAAAPSLAMLALYALTHPEGRMGAGALVCVLLVLVHLVPVGAAVLRRPLVAVECVALAIVATLAVGRSLKRIPTAAVPRVPAPTAASLRAAGIGAGAPVAVVGSPYGQLWAHEADVHIVAVVPLPAREASLRAMATESAARGVPVDAVIWHGDAEAGGAARALAPGWWALRTR